MEKLAQRAARVRGHVIQMSNSAQTAHLASALSVTDILVASAHSLNLEASLAEVPHRNRLILSKGHAVSALYAILAELDFFPLDWLSQYNQDGGSLPEQPSPRCLPGVELATGSLGHGLPVALGMALGARLSNWSSRYIVVMSDGECQEGSVWEAAMMAPHHGLSSLTAIIDHNKWQATGRTQEITGLEPLASKWRAFGWQTHEVDGHDIGAVLEALDAPQDGPKVIVAHTIKGKGVTFMEDDNNWHYRSPTSEEVGLAFTELGL